MGRQSLLTPERQHTIMSYIRAGMWDYIAAEAVGVNQDTFYEWIRRGEGVDGRPVEPVYAEFAEAIRQARAEARGGSEVEVKRKDPIDYLTRGLGRDQPGRPGWTNGGDHQGTQVQTTVNILMTSDWQTVQVRLMAALTRHPEAREDVLRALAPLTDGQDPDRPG